MFSTGAYFKVWSVNNKGNYSEVECSTSKKNNQTQRYETDFSSKYVRFIGEAHRKNPQANERIKITSCGVQNVRENNGQKEYLKNPVYLVFDFERDGGDYQNAPRVSVPHASGNSYMPNAYSGTQMGYETIQVADDGDLPF